MKKRILFTLMVTLIYILGKNVPLMFVVFNNKAPMASLTQMMEYIVGNDPQIPSLFILGLSPWMSAMILSRVISFFMDQDANKVSPYRMRVIQIVLTMVFSVLLAVVRLQDLSVKGNVVNKYGLANVQLMIMVEMIAGACFIVWCVEKNSKYGIGGPSAIIVINILTNMVGIIRKYVYKEHTDPCFTIALIICIAYIVMTVILSIIMYESERRMRVFEAMIHNEYADTNYIEIKFSPLGTLPAMYIIALYSLVGALFSFLHVLLPFAKPIGYIALHWNLEDVFGLTIYGLMFFFLTVLFSMMFVDPKEIAENLQKAGDCIDGVMPGAETSSFLHFIVDYYAILSGAITTLIVVLPLVVGLSFRGMNDLFSMPLSFLILVSIVLNIKEEYATRALGKRYEQELLEV
jgi:preprotein translocase subunit SecY